MKRGKSGQAALEFLTTYGWAFLVILVMIGALAYFGVLDPSGLLPNKCLFGSGIGGCIDYGYNPSYGGTADAIEGVIVNNFGKDISLGASFTISGITVETCDNPAYDLIDASDASVVGGVDSSPVKITTRTWAADEPWTIQVICDETPSGFTAGDRIKVTIAFAGTPTGSNYVATTEGTLAIRIP